MKKCTKCGETKPKTEFHPHSHNKDGLCYTCKTCNSKNSKNYRHSKHGLIVKIYGHQKEKSKRRGHPAPTYSRQELHDWLNNQLKFHVLCFQWENKGFKTEDIPSVDRIDDSKPYTIDNIQLMRWKENNEKAYADIRSGKLTHGSKPQKAVLQFTKNGEFVAEYASAPEAHRKTGANRSNISQCCLGKRYSQVGGYVWKFKNQKEKNSERTVNTGKF